jgi:hypothetical protein
MMSLNVPKPNRARFAVRLNEMGSHPPVEQDVEFLAGGGNPRLSLAGGISRTAATKVSRETGGMLFFLNFLKKQGQNDLTKLSGCFKIINIV